MTEKKQKQLSKKNEGKKYPIYLGNYGPPDDENFEDRELGDSLDEGIPLSLSVQSIFSALKDKYTFDAFEYEKAEKNFLIEKLKLEISRLKRQIDELRGE
jgi:hypothetical protein